MFECGVCLNDYQDVYLQEIVCNHKICKGCFKKWLKVCLKAGKNFSCPICRNSEIPEEEIIKDDYYSRYTKYQNLK